MDSEQDNELSDNVLDVTLFSFEGDFNQQVEEILDRVRLTRDEVENLHSVQDDLILALGYSWPGIRLHPFGSIVSGLGIKTSDIDCYVELPNAHTAKSLVRRAKSVLSKDKSRFRQIYAITTAKVPIVKFIHTRTGFNCDINFSSLSGVRNSKLLAFLFNLDTRALKLAILIKYWSKVYNFTGTNLMPTYTFTLMVVFYLQVKSILPSVADLQRNTQCQWVDGWNTAFNYDFAYVPDVQQTLYELLGGFFEYYKTFDYAQFVISPYLGYPVNKTLLGDLYNLPGVYDLYKENVLREQCSVFKLDAPVCIQDPFDHSKNCSGALFGKLFKKILAHIELANKTFHETSSDDFLREVFTMNIPTESKVYIKPNYYGHRKPKGKGRNSNHLQKQKLKNSLMHIAKQKGFQGLSNVSATGQ